MLATMLQIWFQQIAPDIEIVATASSGRETIRVVREREPDALLQDMMLGDMTGIEIIRVLRAEFPALRIFAMSARPALARLALDSGANGCMLKEDHPHVIHEALLWDASQGVWVSPLLKEKMLYATSEIQKYKLTPGEINVLRLAHLSNAEIASELKLSEGSVRNIFTLLYQKIGIKSRPELAQWAQNVALLSTGNV
jgi:DNA-binding NarL/FixJ family response regulator